MTTTTESPSIWTRSLNWLKRFDEAVSYDSTQYTFDRMTAMQVDLNKLTSPLERLEADRDATPNGIRDQAAA